MQCHVIADLFCFICGCMIVLFHVDVLEYFLTQSELMYPTEFIQLYGNPPQVTLDGG